MENATPTYPPMNSDGTQAPLHEFNLSEKGSSMSGSSKLPVIAAVIAIAAGIATGWGGSQLQSKSVIGPGDGGQPLSQVAGSSIKAGDVFGVQDEKTFKDSAEGYLEIGGLEGEGSHKLLRPGGEAQTVYLTSSITDLDKFQSMQVKVWGETFKGQKAGWLMDVGRVQIVDPKAESPVEN